MAIELANAYVSLKVSAKGIKSDLEKEIGPAAIAASAKAGDDASSAFSKNFGKAGGSLTKVGTIALGAATAMGAGLVKAAGSFEDLAIKSGKFADATGLNVTQASRFIEVAGDLGVESGTLESALNRMNREAANSPDKFDAIGASIVRTKDGAVDVQATFLGVIDHLNAITDPAARAQAATDLLGRGWTGMAELIKGGSSTLVESLKAVSAGQVIDPAELQTAKDYRGDLDALGDSITNLVNGIGKGAAPVIGGLASALGSAVDGVGKLDDVTGGAVGTLATFGTLGLGLIGTISGVAGQAIKMKSRFIDADGALTGFGRTAKGVATGLGAIAAAVTALQIIDELTADTSKADKALTGFLNTAGHAGDGAQGVADILNSFTSLINTTEKSTGIVSQGLFDLKNGYKQADIEAGYAQQSFDKILQSSPEVASTLVGALEQLDVTAKAGGKAAQDTLKYYGLTTEKIAGFQQQVVDTIGAQDTLTGSLDDGSVAVDANARATARAKQATQDLADQQQRSKQLAIEQKAGWEALTGSIDQSKAILNLKDQFDQVNKATTDAWAAAGSGAVESEQKIRDAQLATLDLKQAVIDYGQGLGGLPISWVTKINAEIDAGKIDDAERQLSILARNRDVQISLDLKGATGTFTIVGSQKRARGGPTAPGSWYEVNESGVEMYTENGRNYLLTGTNAGYVTPHNMVPTGENGPEIFVTIGA